MRQLSSEFISSRLSKYYDENIYNKFSVDNYNSIQCERCDLVYSSPMHPGDDRFYDWITKHTSYYPEERWEWKEVISRIKISSNIRKMHLLEIGCGYGEFLISLQKYDNIKAIGIDTTGSSIKECRLKGVDAYCATIESLLNKNNYLKYDCITSFHCLEHVSDPKKFVKNMLSLLEPNGKIYLSTPYSPMSFESTWYDPLNYPPHHLTRWNIKAYEELASQLGLGVNFYMPKAGNVLQRTMYTLNLKYYGPAHMKKIYSLYATFLLKPNVFIRELYNQSKRDKINRRTAADVVLVEMYR